MKADADATHDRITLDTLLCVRRRLVLRWTRRAANNCSGFLPASLRVQGAILSWSIAIATPLTSPCERQLKFPRRKRNKPPSLLD